MALWSKKSFLRRKRISKLARRPRFLAAPERLEDRQMMATWSGDIPDGTVWSSGVQEVIGNAHIPAGATLTIQPGAIVKFTEAGDFSLKVDGTLLAQGTA